MIYIGLLTDAQKRAGFFVTQDEDFVYLFHRDEGTPKIIRIFLYETARIKEVRDAAEEVQRDGGIT
jgi:predicted nuclease of predicted toxin-antitoxin system